MPSLWGGVALTIFSLAAILGVAGSGVAAELSASPLFVGLLYLLLLVPCLYWLYCIYKFHDAIDAVQGYNHPITGARAVALHFIPFYNLYWVFKWPSAIAAFVNWRMQRKAMRGWVAGLVMLVAVLLFRTLSLFGLLAVYAAGFYIARHMRRAFDAPPVPESAKESMTPGFLKLG